MSAVNVYLLHREWTPSMILYLQRQLSRVGSRYVLLDDSGSMYINDGTVTQRRYGQVRVSRWTELTGAFKFHATLAHVGKIPTEFRFLNRSAPLHIGYGRVEDEREYDQFLRICDTSPNGATPLCRHIFEITQEIRAKESELRAAGQVACIVIATDGEASDGDIREALRPLQSLPVIMVLRLCTDEEKVVTYWNGIENDLELPLDVLDDWCGEAEEVKKVNSWLTYGEPLHRLREAGFGLMMKELDRLDEESLSFEGFQRVSELIYGQEAIHGMQSADADSCSSAGRSGDIVMDYLHRIADLNNITSNTAISTYQVWCPERNQRIPWISVAEAKAYYDSDGHHPHHTVTSYGISGGMGGQLKAFCIFILQLVLFFKVMQWLNIW